MERQDEITPSEKTVIDQLRERLKNELPKWFHMKSEEDQNLYLVRWARARDLRLEDATKMLRSTLEWRQELNVDEVLGKSLHPYFARNYPFWHVGTDSHGHPVYLIPFSDWDFRILLNEPDRLAEFDDFVTNFFENMTREVQKAHEKRSPEQSSVTHFTLVINAKDYPYGQLVNFSAMKKILHMAATYEAHYPEILFRAIFVNAPFYFNLFITLLKPVIAPKTLGKITCFGQMPEWRKEMDGWIDPAILPELYGGTKSNEGFTVIR